MRTLRLRKDALTELTTDELQSVVGGIITKACETGVFCLTVQPRCF